jgi:outer membrane receptor protein involved in Fe transport
MRFCLAIFFSFLSGFLMAQAPPNGKITGKVVDAASQKPVEYATITLLNKLSKPVTGAITDAKGAFNLTNIPLGSYLLTIDFIGYQRFSFDSIVISESKKTVALNTIQLKASGTVLADVTVTSKAPIVENKIDKIVYNAANDITSQGGVALDVLKKVPQVTVDIDGNVELQGNSSIRFLINGKPSSMFGNNLADALSSIPASQIKSIEAITSPGAKYDAQGTGGIINIILKDSKVKGYNGSINLGAGSRLENGAFNLNVRHHNFGINTFFSGNAQLSSHTPFSQDRLSKDTAGKKSLHLLQDGYSDFERNGYQAGIGFDWALSKKDNFTASLGYNHFSNTGRGITGQQQTTLDNTGNILADIYTNRSSENYSNAHAIDWSVNYKKKLAKEGQELEFLFVNSNGTPLSNFSQYQVLKGQSLPFAGTKSNNPGTNRETNISLDYTHPFSENGVIETGIKTVIQNIYSDAEVNVLNTLNNQYKNDPAQSYQLNYKRQIFAAYLSGSFAIQKLLNIKAGLRLEHTDTEIDFPNTAIPSYNTLVPSIIFSHNFSEGKSIKLAYTNRIERPDYREINPFLNLADPYNITTGNPLLQPEIGNNFELGFNRSFDGGGNIYVAIVSRFNSHDIKPYTLFYPTFKIGDSVYTNVSVATRLNIGLENRTGISVSGSVPFSKQFTVRTNLFISNRHVVNQLNANSTTDGLDGRINMNATYQLPKNLALEGFVNYNTSVNNIQGKQPQFLAYTFALRKFFMNKKASIGFTATNPFSHYIQQIITVTTQNYSSYSLRQVPYQSFGISFSYKFGKLEFKKVKEDDKTYLNNPPTDSN